MAVCNNENENVSCVNSAIDLGAHSTVLTSPTGLQQYAQDHLVDFIVHYGDLVLSFVYSNFSYLTPTLGL